MGVAWCFDELELGRPQTRAERVDDTIYSLLPDDPRPGM